MTNSNPNAPVEGLVFDNNESVNAVDNNSTVTNPATAEAGQQPVFAVTKGNIGTAVGRFGVSALLAVGMLAPVWTLRGMTVTRFQSIFLADAAIMAFSLVLLVLFPAFVPKHDDYSEPPAQPNA